MNRLTSSWHTSSKGAPQRLAEKTPGHLEAGMKLVLQVSVQVNAEQAGTINFKRAFF